MKILFVYPETPSTFWSFSNALPFISKKAVDPPLGLITVASMLPVVWEKKLIDMNVTPLKDSDIQWADYLFLGGMIVHRESFSDTAARAQKLGTKVVAGGPMCTMMHDELENVDHFILNEAEITLPPFLDDLKKGSAKPVYSSDQFADITKTPLPSWELLDLKKYSMIDIQYSRGCPYNCDFCAITSLYGHTPRTKDTEQFLRELEALYFRGWKGEVFIVDDNFIGNRKKLKNDFLPSLIEWNKSKGHRIRFSTEASVNLADDEQLMHLMIQAGFEMIFVGIETPEEKSLAECGKLQNRNRDLLESVKTLQRQGFRVTGGFIVGFDNDKHDIFERQINFIQKSGIVTAMVGLLNAQLGTPLFKRLKAENRILSDCKGDNMDGTLNFVPKMDREILLEGYKKVVTTIYAQKEYFERVITFLKEFEISSLPSAKTTFTDIKALLRAVWRLGILEHGRRFFWKLMAYSLKNCPKKFHHAVSMAVYGFHFRKVAAQMA
jgi:radical SAM superfamily enzyme YgiQ (UPF0313 family)